MADATRTLRRLCGSPSPRRRFVAVAVLCGAMATANLCIVLSALRHIGRGDAPREFMELRHIEAPQHRRDSIDTLRQKTYEYRQPER